MREDGGRLVDWLEEYPITVSLEGEVGAVTTYVENVAEAELPVWAESVRLEQAGRRDGRIVRLRLRLRLVVPSDRG
jgi:hypothetical protein